MHPIKRAVLVVLLSLGAIGGFSHGFAHLGSCHEQRRDAFEEHIADVCTAAAQRQWDAQQQAQQAQEPIEHHHHHHYGWGGPPPSQWGGPPPQYWGAPPAPPAQPQHDCAQDDSAPAAE